MVRNVIAMRQNSRSQGWIERRSGPEHAALEGEGRCGRPTRLYNDRQLVGKRLEHSRSHDRLYSRASLDIKLAGTCTFGSIRRNASRIASASGRIRELRLLMGAAKAKLPWEGGVMQEWMNGNGVVFPASDDI